MFIILAFILGALWGGIGVYEWATHVARNGHDHRDNSLVVDFNFTSVAAVLGPFYNKVFGFRHSYKK